MNDWYECSNDWNICLNLGATAEYRAKRILEKNGYTVIDVTADEDCRSKDIDFKVKTKKGLCDVEIKNGDKAPYYGSVVIETDEPINKGHKGLGWFNYSEATYFGWQMQNELLLVKAEELRQMIDSGAYTKKNINRYQPASLGYTVPLSDLRQLAHTFTLN